MEKWEYKTEFGTNSMNLADFNYLLQKEGSEGWELVTIIEREEEFRCIFKRKIQQG